MPALERIAVISDVHGNVTAMSAVLADIARRGIERVVNLGDLVGKGPCGAEAIALTRASCEVTVRGNWDSLLGDWEGCVARGEVPRFAAGQWIHEHLDDDDRAWLSGLPGSVDLVLSGRRVRLLHASARSEFVRVLPHHSTEEFEGMFANTDFTGPFTAGIDVLGDGPDATPDVVGYGDIHTAYLKNRRGRTLFNAGAVGNHLDAPSAPYCILEGALDSADPQGFSLAFVRVDYDIDAEVDLARRLGMPDVDLYERELREGIYRGRGSSD